MDEAAETISTYMRYTPLTPEMLARAKQLVATNKKQRTSLLAAGVNSSHVGVAKSMKQCQFEGCDADIMNKKCMFCPSHSCGGLQQKGYDWRKLGKRKRSPTED